MDRGNNRALQYNQPLPNPLPALWSRTGHQCHGRPRGSFTLGIWGTGIISDTVVQINGMARTLGSDFLGYTRVTITASEVITSGQFTVTCAIPRRAAGCPTSCARPTPPIPGRTI